MAPTGIEIETLAFVISSLTGQSGWLIYFENEPHVYAKDKNELLTKIVAMLGSSIFDSPQSNPNPIGTESHGTEKPI